MRLSKKVALGTAALAIAGVGLTGCGNRNQSSQQSSQQKAERSSSSQESPAQRGQEDEDMANQLNDMPPQSATTKKYGKYFTAEMKNSTTTAENVDVITLHKPANPKVKMRWTDQYESGKDRKPYSYKFPAKKVIQNDWKDIYAGISKEHLNPKHPLRVQFRYMEGLQSNDDTPTYEVYNAKTNSPKLHDLHMNPINSDADVH